MLLCMVAASARADESRVPAGMMLCHTIEAAVSKAHAGCWLARGGQRVEILAATATYVQLRIWSTDGSETSFVYATPADADRLRVEIVR